MKLDELHRTLYVVKLMTKEKKKHYHHGKSYDLAQMRSKVRSNQIN